MVDLEEAAIIREVHVYGQSLALGDEQYGIAQHSGLGTRLIQHAEEIAHKAGYRKMAVIAAVGTRAYYAERGYALGENYMLKTLE
jgi:elongator complex protein 3